VIPVTVVENYKDSLMKMGILVIDLFDKSIYALINRDSEMAKKVISDDELADEMRNKIVEDGILIIGEYAPIGKPLVQITNGIWIANVLEMIGDNSKKISYHTIELTKEPMLKPLVDLPKMASIAEGMLRKSMTFYSSNFNERIMDELVENEVEVDDLSERIEDELKLYMMESSKNVSRALRLIMISKSIEEVTDFCLKISSLQAGGGAF
jgi:phosphate transport system protein